jgi:hypothetical protein
MHRKLLFTAFAVVITLYGLSFEFSPELSALTWHLGHGGSATVRRYQIPVPPWWLGEYNEDHSTFTASYFRGRFRSALQGKTGWATIWFPTTPYTPGETTKRSLSRLDQLRGTTTTVTSLFITGQATSCFNSTHVKTPTILEISCVPDEPGGDFTATFMGTRDLAPEFFAILRGVQRRR